MKKREVVLLVHGSSRPEWNQHMFELVDQLNDSSETVCYSVCFLEKSSPSLFELVNQLVDQGCSSFDLYPLFFAPGRHVYQDIPQMISDICERFSIQISLQPCVGTSPLFPLFLKHLIEGK